MKTHSSVISILLLLFIITSNLNAQEGYAYNTDQKFSEAVSRISSILKSKVSFNGPVKDNLYPNFCDQKNIVVLEDRIELKNKKSKQTFVIYYSDLLKLNIRYHDDVYFSWVMIGDYLFQFSNPIKENGRVLYNDLKLIRNLVSARYYVNEIALFEPIASDYRGLKVKPTITEEQRKYVVQANLFNEEKKYDKAIELYLKVIAINPTSFPGAYSNLALLYAITENYYAAIYNMKKYIMLVPEAEDARAAQDKIYRWETKIE